MNNSKGITLLLMIFIVLLLTIGAGVIASQIAADIRSARTYYESTRAFYIAWSSVANERTWMTSGARRTAAGNDTLCGAGTSNNDCAVSVTGFVAATEFYDRDSQGVALPAGDIRRGRREYSFQILQPNNVNAVLGDGQVKVIGSFPGNDRVATRDPMSRTALLERTVWRDMKAFDDPAHPAVNPNEPAKAIDADPIATQWQYPTANTTGWFYVDFGQLETVDRVSVKTLSGTVSALGITLSYWDESLSPPNWSAIAGATWMLIAGTPDTLDSSVFAIPTTRRIRLSVTPRTPPVTNSANLVNIEVKNGANSVRRQGTVRPGRFSYSTNFDYTQFN